MKEPKSDMAFVVVNPHDGMMMAWTTRFYKYLAWQAAEKHLATRKEVLFKQGYRVYKVNIIPVFPLARASFAKRTKI